MSPLAAAASPMTLGSSCGCNGLADMTHRDHAWPTSEIMQCRGKHIYMYCRFSGGGGMGYEIHVCVEYTVLIARTTHDGMLHTCL